MKNGLIIWNVVLTLVAGYLLFNQFSSRKGSDKGSKISVNDSIVHNGNFRIAYFEMDSLANNFDMVKEVKAELTKKETENSGVIERMAKGLQEKYLFYQKQYEAGTLTQTQYEAASVELKKMEENIRVKKEELDRDYFDIKTRRENEVKKNIEGFIKDYNKNKNYTYIMSYEPGLFYYKDTALNITADVIKGLNVAFPSIKKKTK